MDIVGKRAWFFLFSALIILPGVISMAIPPTLRPGIDFTSGTVLNINFDESASEANINEDKIRDELTRLGHPEALIQKIGDRSVFIRTFVLEQDVQREDGSITSEQALVEEALTEKIGRIESREVDTTSPILARETVRNTILAVVVATIFIFIYVSWAFRAVPNSYRYGFAAIIALVHDVLVIIGIFSILGKTINMEVNSMFIVGLLLVVGYSVNDTIVVFDRIRENVARHIDRPLPGIVNTSILESIGRSLNTSFTTLIVLLALFLVGGPTIQGLLLVLVIGVVVGTYSSICIASQFLVLWDRGELGYALRFLTPWRRRRTVAG